MCLDRTFYKGFVIFGLLFIKINNSRLFFSNNSQNSENFNKLNTIEKYENTYFLLPLFSSHRKVHRNYLLVISSFGKGYLK